MPYYYPVGFKQNLREELNFQDLTVKELAVRAEVAKGALEMYLGVRESMPPADAAVRIAKALGVTVEYLVNGEDTEPGKKYAASREARKLHQFIEKLDNTRCKALLGLIRVFQGREP
ncbi:hypothetical protein AGMMS49928_22840 [Spirochaetia bacterium]|nr:hypothetical protein AGMMS49928_22840 [Spirochaetia bacterium]